jgi:uncharacterized repeat protein (TIGR03843 family)
MNSTGYVRGMPSQNWQPAGPEIADVLNEAQTEEAFILAAGSNRVYLLRMSHPTAGEGYAIYKPQRGEAPLSDFPDGTLYQRERASYLVSEALGWGLIPPTIVRDDLEGGLGVLQVFVEHDPAENFFTLRDSREDEMKRIAVFDWLTNNADRKGGHCLLARDGRMWCIDQGLTFHVEDKLRTVIWDYQGHPVPDALADEIRAFGQRLDSDAVLHDQLSELITDAEYARLIERAHLIDKRRIYPPPPAYRPYPWPMI